jgi:acyl-CoA thioester hydrolase
MERPGKNMRQNSPLYHQGHFRCPLKIRETDLDALGHVNNVVYVRWVQEAAEAHWTQLADIAVRHANLWVVVRHEIDYISATMPDDKPFAWTWVGETNALRSVRHVDIHADDGRLLASALTTWCLYDPVSKKPRRIPSEVKKMLLPGSD